MRRYAPDPLLPLPARAARRGGSSLSRGLRLLATELRRLLTPDLFAIVLLAITLGPFVASVLRHLDNALLLSAMIDDDALISLQLDGMTAWPWGNPANYLGERGAAGMLPPYWYALSYQNLPYYGGLYLDIAFVLWAPLKLLGVPFFPVAPAILRVLALLFTACTVLAGYNLARLHFGRLAGCLAGLLFASDYALYQIGASIHPDSLLFLVTLLALQLCIVHAGRGSPAGVVAIGLVAGLAQGAKMGGPALVPVTALALALGSKELLRSAGWPAWLKAVLRDGAIAAAVALVTFFATTPYALLDSYFFRTWLHWAKLFTGPSPMSTATFADWAEQAAGYLGTPVLALAAAGLVIPLLLQAGRSRWLPFLLAVCLGATVFLYYALFQKYWVQLQYLVIAYWLAALLAAVGLATGAQAISRWVPLLRVPLAAVLLAAGTAFFLLRMQSPLFLAFQYIHWKASPQYQVGAWVARHLPPEDESDSVIADGPTYLPPDVVDRYAFLGGPVRYQDLAERLPDYFVLTRYRANWQVGKITGPLMDPWDPSNLNVRLYQDLLGTSAGEVVPVQAGRFATRMHSVGWSRSSDGTGICNGSAIECMPISPARIALISEQARRSIAYARHVSLYRLDKEKFAEQLPAEHRLLVAQPLASSTTPDSRLDDVLKGAAHWRSTRQGSAANGEYVGFELPRRMQLQPRELTIRWVAWHWVPRTLAVDHSDDGKTWVQVAEFAVQQPADVASRMNGMNRWDDIFAVPESAGAHRYWRVRAGDVPEGGFFGLERISAR